MWAQKKFFETYTQVCPKNNNKDYKSNEERLNIQVDTDKRPSSFLPLVQITMVITYYYLHLINGLHYAYVHGY